MKNYVSRILLFKMQAIGNAHRDWICGLACLPDIPASTGVGLLLSACRAGTLKAWTLTNNCTLIGEIPAAHVGQINCICTSGSAVVFTGST